LTDDDRPRYPATNPLPGLALLAADSGLGLAHIGPTYGNRRAWLELARGGPM
jgi:hypothetical protein